MNQQRQLNQQTQGDQVYGFLCPQTNVFYAF